MPGLNINFGTSVFKRENRPFSDVVKQFQTDGWSRTGEFGNKLVYLQKDGIGITIANGPMATLVFPSGPIRGRLFGTSGLSVGKKSVLGTGQVNGEAGRQQRNAEKMSQQYV